MTNKWDPRDKPVATCPGDIISVFAWLITNKCMPKVEQMS